LWFVLIKNENCFDYVKKGFESYVVLDISGNKKEFDSKNYERGKI